MDAIGAYTISECARECVYDIRVSLIGDSDVGKTTISMVFCGKAATNTRPTIGYEFGTAHRKYSNGDTVRYVIVDTAGQERYCQVLPSYLKNSDAVVVVYDVSHRKTFEHVDRWLNVVHSRLPCDTPTILVGNKCDKTFLRDVSYEEGQMKAEKHNMFFVESSALTGLHIHGIFEQLSMHIREKKLNEMFNGAKKPLSDAAIRLPDKLSVSGIDQRTGCCNT